VPRTITDREGETYRVSRSRTWKRQLVFTVRHEGKPIARAMLAYSQAWVLDIEVDEGYRRRRIATALYDYIESVIGHPLKPSPALQPDGRAFWDFRTRDRESRTPAECQELG